MLIEQKRFLFHKNRRFAQLLIHKIITMTVRHASLFPSYCKTDFNSPACFGRKTQPSSLQCIRSFSAHRIAKSGISALLQSGEKSFSSRCLEINFYVILSLRWCYNCNTIIIILYIYGMTLARSNILLTTCIEHSTCLQQL